ncbi:STAS domain-containing protein [Ketobacter sp. MCCC 1A13808]|uniref:STAS domain-containing protein n=1 Tax=Ketobacter sp. MCCC 1A13808 TaxID=2602738 RepID=UPI000F235A82|nr:STAS domain-containing protein [Ketobacter sp. MCCC 1A13808]MVF11238.1 STAS domain-containing protein [Ketobacter sp. MCCC 1A13808]RLP53631.1 MAG: STAS domain-containing protein [Ketobacter sp.]
MSPDQISALGVSLIRVSDHKLEISGDMVFASATWLRSEGEKLLPGMGDRIVVDLAQVGRVGSVGISVLLCWMRMAQVLGKELQYVNAPDDMLDVSRVSSLDSVIPFAS